MIIVQACNRSINIVAFIITVMKIILGLYNIWYYEYSAKNKSNLIFVVTCFKYRDFDVTSFAFEVYRANRRIGILGPIFFLK